MRILLVALLVALAAVDAYAQSAVERGKYLVEVDVESDGDSLKRASVAMTKALDRLPRE